jgi:hypothetical protein
MTARTVHALALGLLLTACAATGNGHALGAGPEALQGTLSIGRSTRADVARELGPGIVERLSNGYEVWIYRDSTAVPRFVDTIPLIGLFSATLRSEEREVALLFDREGILRNVDWRGVQPASSRTESQ